MEELLNQYNIPTLEECKERHGDSISTEIFFYQTFLVQTDHITSEILEQLMEDLSESTGLEFMEAYMMFMENIKVKYAEILKHRRIAREEIKKLEEERTLIEGENTDTNIS